jgi:hypothetical protein
MDNCEKQGRFGGVVADSIRLKRPINKSALAEWVTRIGTNRIKLVGTNTAFSQ